MSPGTPEEQEARLRDLANDARTDARRAAKDMMLALWKFERAAERLDDRDLYDAEYADTGGPDVVRNGASMIRLAIRGMVASIPPVSTGE